MMSKVTRARREDKVTQRPVGTQRAEEVRYGWCLFLAPLAHPVFTLGHISPVCHGTYTWD